MGRYFLIAGLASAVAAAFLLFLQLSSYGELPIVKPSVLELGAER